MANQTVLVGDNGVALTAKLANNFGDLYAQTASYNVAIPFNRGCTVCEHTLITNDTLAPSIVLTPIPGFGAIYRLIGDGTHIPVFNGFRKSNSSFAYVETAGVVNIVVFLYDGFEYWYTINQAI